MVHFPMIFVYGTSKICKSNHDEVQYTMEQVQTQGTFLFLLTKVRWCKGNNSIYDNNIHVELKRVENEKRNDIYNRNMEHPNTQCVPGCKKSRQLLMLRLKIEHTMFRMVYFLLAYFKISFSKPRQAYRFRSLILKFRKSGF